MQFDSASFVALVLFGVTGFWALKYRPTSRAVLLLILSMVFYLSANWKVAHLLLWVTVLDYLTGLMIDRTEVQWKRSAWLTASMIGNLGVLAYFKYFNFLAGNLYQLWHWLNGIPGEYHPRNIFLPAGIAFYTFQS